MDKILEWDFCQWMSLCLSCLLAIWDTRNKASYVPWHPIAQQTILKIRFLFFLFSLFLLYQFKKWFYICMPCGTIVNRSFFVVGVTLLRYDLHVLGVEIIMYWVNFYRHDTWKYKLCYTVFFFWDMLLRVEIKMDDKCSYFGMEKGRKIVRERKGLKEVGWISSHAFWVCFSHFMALSGVSTFPPASVW